VKVVNRGFSYTSFSDDARLAVTAAASGAKVWEVYSGTQLAWLPLKLGRRTIFSPDDRLIATADRQRVRIWAWASRRPVTAVRSNGFVSCMAFSPDRKLLATCSSDVVTIWRLVNRTRVAVLRGHDSTVYSVKFSRNGELVVTASDDGTALIWNATSGDVVRVLRGHETQVLEEGLSKAVFDATFSPDGKLVATAGSDGTARVWATSPVPQLATLAQRKGGIDSIDFNKDGKRVVTANEDGTARIWTIAERRQGASLQVGPVRYPVPVDSAAFSPKGRLVAVSGQSALLWDPMTKTTTRVGAGGHDVAFSPTGRLLAWADADMARVWDVKRRQQLATLPAGRREPVYGVAFNPNGKLIATAAQNGSVQLWRPDGKRIALLSGHRQDVWDAAFSPDGKLLATVGTDGTMRLWDVDAREPKAVVHLGAPAWTVSFSSNGRFLALSTQGFTSRVWELATGATVLTLPGIHARFAPRSNRIATIVGDTVKLWRCDVCGSADELLSLADARTVRPLTPDERRMFLHEG
jgi:WD40 repeat protein